MLKAAILALVCLFSSQAFGQDTLYLIRVVDGNPEQPTVVWWQGNTANYSEDDNTLIAASRDQNLDILQPTDLSQISRILRQPVLSDANAANLARLLGAEIAVLGAIELVGPSSLSVLPLYGFRGELRGKVMRFDGTEVATEEIEIIQHAYSQHANDSRKRALEQLGRRLALSVRQSKSLTTGPVGIQTPFPVLKFDGLGTGRALDLVSNFLIELVQVQDVEVVWAGRGQVALKVLNKQRESLDQLEVEQIARSLVNAQFDGFKVTMTAEASSQNVVEFRLVSSDVQP